MGFLHLKTPLRVNEEKEVLASHEVLVSHDAKVFRTTQVRVTKP